MMKKTLLAAATAAMLSLPAMAGGLMENTNQNIAFLRNPARDAAIGIDGVYSNPAGVAFMPEGWYCSVNLQNAHQTRTITSSFPGFASGDGQLTHEYKGKSDVPVLPSVQAAKNWGRWSFQFNFAITGGGGKCEFDQGLGSIESLVSLVPGVFNALGGTLNAGMGGKPIFPTDNTYSHETFMRGRQYYYGYTLGAAYRMNDQWSFYAGARLLYGTTNYYGYVKNIHINTAGSTALPAAGRENIGKWMTDNAGVMRQALGQVIGNPDVVQAAMPLAIDAIGGVLDEGIQLNCDQEGYGIAPIIGVDWRPNEKWNVAMKYEFKTRMRLENRATNSGLVNLFPQLSRFADGKTDAEDMPALLTIGAQFSPRKDVRVNAGYHRYFDKDGHQHDNVQSRLGGDTHEWLLGAEWDVNDRFTVSAGGQRTQYDLADDYMDDISFNVSSCSLGFGLKFKVSDAVDVNVAYFHTFYDDYSRQQADYNRAGATGRGLVDNLEQGLGQMLGTPSGQAVAQLAQLNVATLTQLVEGVKAQIPAQMPGSDTFTRSNRVIGVGVDFKF